MANIVEDNDTYSIADDMKDILSDVDGLVGPETTLAQDQVGGWMPAPSVPGALIINIGDILARWTNEVFNSTPHRVINPSARRSRYSVGMFFDPDIDAHIRCLDQFTEGGQPVKHPPIRYGDYFQNRLDNNYPDRVGVVATTSL